MIIKFNDYIKENNSISIEDILIYLNYDVKNKINNILIKIIDSNIKQELKPQIISSFDEVINLYVDDSSTRYNSVAFQLKTQEEYYYVIFYFVYLLNFKYNNSGLSRAYVINIEELTNIEILDLIKTFFNYLQNNKFPKLIDEYINRNNKIDDIIFKCLNTEQKIKYQHLLNAKNFDLI